MPIERAGYPLPQRTPSPRISVFGRRQGGRQWLRLWRAERRRTRFQRLEELWDAQHEQMWTPTAYSYRDFVLHAMGPALRLAIYQYLALF
jgi:hypothetical protein